MGGFHRLLDPSFARLRLGGFVDPPEDEAPLPNRQALEVLKHAVSSERAFQVLRNGNLNRTVANPDPHSDLIAFLDPDFLPDLGLDPKVMAPPSDRIQAVEKGVRVVDSRDDRHGASNIQRATDLERNRYREVVQVRSEALQLGLKRELPRCGFPACFLRQGTL